MLLCLEEPSMKITQTKDGCILEVSVKPRSREFSILCEADEIIIRSREEPIGGRVNKELIKELSRLFGGRVEIVAGSTSKRKMLLLKGVEKSEVERLLKNR
jgi:uncharacterized protein (TIGR00251 family)